MRKDSAQDADYVKTSVNMPRALRDSLKASGKANGRTMNAEIVARALEAEDRATFRQLVKQNDELRALMREMLDRLELLK